jgi:hypothetical protein
LDRSLGEDTIKNQEITISTSGLKAIKEGDLLILSKVDLLDGSDDIKPKMTADWLKENVNIGKSIMVFVTERGKKGSPTLTIKVDCRAAEKFVENIKEEEEK